MLREECSRDKFKLDYDRPEEFTLCQWQKKPGVLAIWVAYRVVLVIYFIGGILVVFAAAGQNYPWYRNFMFFTYWSYVAEVTAFCLALVVTVEKYVYDKNYPRSPPLTVMPCHYKLLWYVYSTAAPTAIFISIIFWVFLYNPKVDGSIGYRFITHVFNGLFMTIDFFLYAIPYRYLHVYMPLVYCLAYGVFTVTYQFSGGTGIGQIPIYPNMDWRDPGGALMTFFIYLVCLAVVHCVLAVAHMVKQWIKKTREENQ